MSQKLRDAVRPAKGGSLAKSFARLGWIGFWLQVVFGSIPLIAMAYFLAFSPSSTVSRSGIPFVEYLTIANLLILVFTTCWAYRYTRLARRIAVPDRRPSESHVTRTVWTGVVAGAVGLLFSMTVMFVEAANLLFTFLKAPQAGIPVIQTSGAEAPHMVSSVDMVSLMALILIQFSVLFFLVFSLWLLFRTTLNSSEYPQAAAPPA
jgi:hypothetical protein